MKVVVELRKSSITHSEANIWFIKDGALVIGRKEPDYRGFMAYAPGKVFEHAIYAPGHWLSARAEP